MLEHEREELLGQPVELPISAELRKTHQVQRSSHVAAAGARPMGSGVELHDRRADGTEFPLEIGLTSLPDHGIGEDVTDTDWGAVDLNAERARFMSHRRSDRIDGLLAMAQSQGCSEEEVVEELGTLIAQQGVLERCHRFRDDGAADIRAGRLNPKTAPDGRSSPSTAGRAPTETSAPMDRISSVLS
ncbi:MAG: hypothetical protein GY698_10365, partial [Actinomycetia bacterium]|nr:hypothetical protein [Actinomycetes bacterium]